MIDCTRGAIFVGTDLALFATNDLTRPPQWATEKLLEEMETEIKKQSGNPYKFAEVCLQAAGTASQPTTNVLFRLAMLRSLHELRGNMIEVPESFRRMANFRDALRRTHDQFCEVVQRAEEPQDKRLHRLMDLYQNVYRLEYDGRLDPTIISAG